jgi:hypothetical protein
VSIPEQGSEETTRLRFARNFGGRDQEESFAGLLRHFGDRLKADDKQRSKNRTAQVCAPLSIKCS